MPTKFIEVFERAVFKFKDIGFSKLIPDFKEALLTRYLISSCVDFMHSCPSVDDYDLELEQFNTELDSEIIEILADGIVVHFVQPKVLNADLLRPPVMYNKDYQTYSAANQIKEIRAVHESLEKKYRGKINTYSFRMSNLANLKVGG